MTMLWVCSECTTKYSVGARQCPQCGSTESHEDGAGTHLVDPVQPISSVQLVEPDQ